MPFGTKNEPAAVRAPAEMFSERLGHYPVFMPWHEGGFGNSGGQRQVWQNTQDRLPTPGASSYAYITQGLPLLPPLGAGTGYGMAPSPIGGLSPHLQMVPTQSEYLRPGTVGHMQLATKAPAFSSAGY